MADIEISDATTIPSYPFEEQAGDLAAPAAGLTILWAKATGLFTRRNGGAATRLATADDLAGKADTSHAHAASAVTSGQLAIARGGTGSDLSSTGGSNQVLKQSTLGGNISVGVLSEGELPALSAAKITSGQISLARGGTSADLSATGGTSHVLKQTGIGASVTVGQLAFSDLSGSIATSQIPNTVVTPGSYTNANITVDAQGRLTAAANGSGGGMTSFTAAADSGSNQTISDGNTLTIAGGTGIGTVASATDTVTVNLDINEMTEDTSPTSGYMLPAYTGSVLRKLSLQNIFAAMGSYIRQTIIGMNTGDPRLMKMNASTTLWVMANGKTIGDASSGATERANADMSSLFAALWSETYSTVQDSSGGASTKGANAAADFAAHKRLVLPDGRGRTGIAYDQPPSGSAANNITGSWADSYAGTGGEELHTMTQAELVAHSHTLVTNTGTATTYGSNYRFAYQSGDTWAGNGSAGTAISGNLNNTGSTTPFNVVQPSIVLGNWFLYTGN